MCRSAAANCGRPAAASRCSRWNEQRSKCELAELWNNMRVRRIVICLITGAALLAAWAAAHEEDHTPQLLLGPKLIRTLQRDRQRQTVRWLNFENRVQTAPD